MSGRRVKRGIAAKRLETLDRLRPLLRADVPLERTLRAVASVLAVDLGEYCIVDVAEKNGIIRRIAIEHPDPSRAVKLEVAVASSMDASTNLRATRLVARGERELVSRVTDAYRTRSLTDVTLLKGEVARSYMAVPVVAGGATIALFTMVSTHSVRRYTDEELGFLNSVAEWTALAAERAMRRDDDAPRSQRIPDEMPTGVKRRASGTLPMVRTRATGERGR